MLKQVKPQLFYYGNLAVHKYSFARCKLAKLKYGKLAVLTNCTVNFLVVLTLLTRVS